MKHFMLYFRGSVNDMAYYYVSKIVIYCCFHSADCKRSWIRVHNMFYIYFSDPTCELSSARDHARETLRVQTAPERFVSHSSLSCATDIEFL